MESLVRWADRYIRAFLYLITIAAVFAEVWLFGFAPSPIQKSYLIPMTVLLSTGVATCGWLWTGHWNRKLSRKIQALDFLKFIRNEQVSSWKNAVYAHINAKVASNTIIPTVEIEQLLGVYEFLGIAIRSGAVDEEMIKNSQQYIVLRLYKGLNQFIDDRRQLDPKLYVHFMHYVEKWNPEEPAFFKTGLIKPEVDITP